MPIVRQKMQEFLSSGGATLQKSNTIYVKNIPMVTPATGDNNDDSHLTAKERAMKRKEDRIQ